MSDPDPNYVPSLPEKLKKLQEDANEQGYIPPDQVNQKFWNDLFWHEYNRPDRVEARAKNKPITGITAD